MGWEINSIELGNKLAEHGVPEGVSETELEQIALLLTHRIGQENAMKQRWQRSRGDHYTIHKADLNRAVSEAIDNPRHYLHLADKRLTAATLIALQELINPNIDHRPVDVQQTLATLSESDHAWMLFLRGFFTGRLDPLDRMIAGAWEVSSTWSLLKGLGSEAVRGGAQFLINVGDSADMRLNVVIRRTLKAFDSLDIPSEETQRKVVEERKKKGLPIPPSSKEAAEIRKRLAGYMESYASNAELIASMNDHISLRSDIDNLLIFIATYGRRRLGNEASEVLLASRTDLYPQRAAVPVGQPSPNTPKIDPQNQAQVFAFLKTLGIKVTEDTKEAVWAYWKGAWDQNIIRAYDIAWDLDHTLYEYRANLLNGTEDVQMHPVLIRLVALALRDEAPITIITNTIRSRIADVANHPAFGAFRFAAFLRMPEDPYITVEEVASMRSITTYEELVGAKTLSLEAFSDEGSTFTERVAQGLVARALLATYREKSIIQGDKDRRVIEQYLNKIVPLIIIDDQVEHAQTFIDSGGKVAIVVPRVTKNEPLHDPERAVIDIFTTAQELSQMTTLQRRVTEVDRERDASSLKTEGGSRPLTEGDFPKIAATVKHPDFARKIIDGWLTPARRMWAQKRKVIKELEKQGRYKEALGLALNLATFRDVRVSTLQQLRAEVEGAAGDGKAPAPTSTDTTAAPAPESHTVPHPLAALAGAHLGEPPSAPVEPSPRGQGTPPVPPRDPVAEAQATSGPADLEADPIVVPTPSPMAAAVGATSALTADSRAPRKTRPLPPQTPADGTPTVDPDAESHESRVTSHESPGKPDDPRRLPFMDPDRLPTFDDPDGAKRARLFEDWTGQVVGHERRATSDERRSHQVTRKPSTVDRRPSTGSPKLTHIYIRLIQAGELDLKDELMGREQELSAEHRGRLARASRNGIALVATAEEILAELEDRQVEGSPNQRTRNAALRAAERARMLEAARLLAK